MEGCVEGPSRVRRQSIEGLEYEIEEGLGTVHSYTFYPTRTQCTPFSKMMQLIEKTDASATCGVVKIVPPSGWQPRTHGYKSVWKSAMVKKPVFETIEKGMKVGTYVKNVTVFKKECTADALRVYAREHQLEQAPPAKDRAEMDAAFWNRIETGDNEVEAVYGADSEGSLYDDSEEVLDMRRLGTILDMLDGTRIHGVNSVYLYFGMYKSMFPWHAEDGDLYSINYVHQGAAKHWWAVPPEAADLFERLMAQIFPEDAKKCPAFLRHKNHIVSPDILRSNGIPFSTVTQNQGEFVITFPRGYHMGYNTGLNIAESTNFATNRWIDFGKNAVFCTCKKDSVYIGMEPFMEGFRNKEVENWRRLRDRILWHEKKKSDEGIAERKKKESMRASAPPDFFSEKTSNGERSIRFPHCAVCQSFIPEHACKEIGRIPERSVRIVRNRLFSKRQEINETVEDPSEDALLTCVNCRVTVHAHCYPTTKPMDNWTCQRCTKNDDTRIRTVTCVLCERKGGAYVKTSYGHMRSYVHVVCAIMHRRSYFLDIANRSGVVTLLPSKYLADPAELSAYIDPAYIDKGGDCDSLRYECANCGSFREGLLFCHGCVEGPVTTSHATCARECNMRLEMRDFPFLTVLWCSSHTEDMSVGIPHGTVVLVSGKEGFITDEGKGKTLMVVDFYDDSRSNNVLPEDIKSCNCGGCDGIHHVPDIGVRVIWNDGELYDGYFRGIAAPEKYTIQFNDGTTEKVAKHLIRIRTIPRSASKSPKKRTKLA